MASVLRATICLCFFTSFTVHAFSGRDLKTACDSGDRYVLGGSGFKEVGDAYSGGECIGYIHGVNDALTEGVFCPGGGVTVGEEVKSVRAYLTRHHERLTEPAGELVREALITAYPCAPQ